MYTLGWEPCPSLVWDLPTQIDAQIFWDFDEFRRSSADQKIAFYHMAWDGLTSGEDQQQVEQRRLTQAQNIIDCCDLVFFAEDEIHSDGFQFYGEQGIFLHHRAKWIMPGHVDSLGDRTVIRNYHIWRTANVYRQIPEVLRSLTPHQPKPRYFDALLGTEKPHRRFVWDHVQSHGLGDRVQVSMYPAPGSPGLDARNSPDAYIWEPDTEPLEGHDYRAINQLVRYHGRTVQMACVMPISVYNQTAYSLVTETGAANGIHMFTEKIAKPMIARRLFVVFAGQGYLRRLRQSGFLTFHGIIDESYDDMHDDQARWNKAFDQVRYLCSQDQDWVLDTIRPIVEHNHQKAMSQALLSDPIHHVLQFLRPMT
jgi:hypothetical protein